MIYIRPIIEADAEAYLNLMLALDNETKFMLYEPDERKGTVDEISARIKHSIASGSLLLVAEDVGNLIGFISASRGHTRRISHSAYIVIGISEAYHGQGIGKKFFKELDDWALKNNIKRLELTVMEHNVRAIKLYKSCGFKVEGVKEKAILLDGAFINEFYMAKIY